MYGSPNLDDISRFSRALSAVLNEQLGPEDAGSLQFDVSSPVRLPEFGLLCTLLFGMNWTTNRGWNHVDSQLTLNLQGGLRALAVPQELERFRSVALEVEFVTSEPVGAQQPAATRRVLLYIGLTAGGDTRWHLHDIPFNWQAMGKKKGQKLSKRELETEIVIPQPNIRTARFYFDLDF